MVFTGLEQSVLNRVQHDFPLVRDPFTEMSRELSLHEDEFLTCVRSLKAGGVIRNISGIFNADRLGYVTVLCAFQVGDDDIDDAVRTINAHPGVSHNYLRKHRYNLWFTLTSESDEKLKKSVRFLREKTRAADHLLFKNERLLKIGLILHVGGDELPDDARSPAPSSQNDPGYTPLSDGERETIRLLQHDLPLEPFPFARLLSTDAGSLDEDSFLDHSRALREKRVLRRYCAVMRHNKAGFTSNAMTVWKPAGDTDLDRIARIFYARPSISHLYLRSAYPGEWEYPLFAMIHARSDGELDEIIRGLARESGLGKYQVLRTLREFKKERVTYFSPRFREWEAEAGI
jgi:DNA-binding Lrp family transcriptional regulator